MVSLTACSEESRWRGRTSTALKNGRTLKIDTLGTLLGAGVLLKEDLVAKDLNLAIFARTGTNQRSVGQAWRS